ncbi:MAG: glycosyltransferase family 4 protein [bacterium]|nr:glycosyltransferase family 4 protein [bacterium]
MNVLFVLEYYYPHIGGVEIVFKNLAEGLIKKGHSVDVVTRRLKGTKRFEILNGVRIHRVRSLNRYFFTVLAAPKAVRLAKRADIIHTTTFNGAPPAWFAAKVTGKKCVITIHEVWINMWNKLGTMSWLNQKIHNFLERLIYSLSYDRYVCVSKSTQRQLAEIGKRKSVVVYNGMDYNHFNPKRYNKKELKKIYGIEKSFLCLTYGRPGPSKGIEYAVKAIPHINIPNLKYMLIITKAYPKEYRKIVNLIHKLGIRDKVILVDPVPFRDLPRYTTAADCIVVPSLSEGFGYAAAEGCASDTAVVASDTTSLPEVVSGKYILVPPKSPKAIAEAVESVKKGKYKKTAKKRFTLEKNVEGYLDVYKGLSKK